MSYYKHSPKRKAYNMRKLINRDQDDELDSSERSMSTQTENFEPRYRIANDPELAAFSYLVEGIGFSQFQLLLLFNNFCRFPKNQFFNSTNRICFFIS